MKLLFDKKARRIRFDILYFASIYFLLLTSLILSDIGFVLSVADVVHTQLAGFSGIVWGLAIIMFVVSTFATITTEKGEMNVQNFLLIFLMYVVYSQMWLAVAFNGMVGYIREQIFHKEAKWYKTKRYQ